MAAAGLARRVRAPTRSEAARRAPGVALGGTARGSDDQSAPHLSQQKGSSGGLWPPPYEAEALGF